MEDNGDNREKAERFTGDLLSWRQLQALYRRIPEHLSP